MTSKYQDLARSFERHDLDNSAFGHDDHVGVAYEMLKAHDFAEAAFRYAGNIRAIAAKAGAPEKFNATITFAFMSLIAERMETTEHDDFASFIAANRDLNSKDVLQKWYSPQRLQSASARRIFLLPDVASP